MAGIIDEMSDRTIILPITEEARAVANRLAEGQPTPQKAEQVRLNTLAVSAVNNYLRMMDIPTDITASYSRKPFMLMLNDVADLVIPGLGRLECRPVKAHAQSCHVPVEVWDDRIGYVAVQMDEELEEAALVGFAQGVEDEEIPLNQFQPLQILLRHLHQLLLPVPVSSSVRPAGQFANLSRWLQNTFEAGWQTVDLLFSSSRELKLASGFRSTEKLAAIFGATSIKSNSQGGGKVIHLQTPQGSHSMVLAVLVTPGDDSASTTEGQETNILIRVISPSGETSLPSGLQLMVLEESGAVFDEIQAKPGDNYLQLPIGGHSGEKFSVRVALDGISITEDFVI